LERKVIPFYFAEIDLIRFEGMFSGIPSLLEKIRGADSNLIFYLLKFTDCRHSVWCVCRFRQSPINYFWRDFPDLNKELVLLYRQFYIGCFAVDNLIRIRFWRPLAGYGGVEPFVFNWAKKIYVLLNEFLSKFHFLLVWLIDSGLFR